MDLDGGCRLEAVTRNLSQIADIWAKEYVVSLPNARIRSSCYAVGCYFSALLFYLARRFYFKRLCAE